MGKLKSYESLWIYSMGKRFSVTGIFLSPDEANKYLEGHKEEGVIAEIQGIVFTAHLYRAEKA